MFCDGGTTRELLRVFLTEGPTDDSKIINEIKMSWFLWIRQVFLFFPADSLVNLLLGMI
jgi:hypothetical protein